MTQILAPGQNTALPAAQTYTVQVKGAAAHVDPIILLLDDGGRALSDESVALFSNPSIESGSVVLDVPSDTVTINVAALPGNVKTVLLVAQADGQDTVQGAGSVTAVVQADGAPAAQAQIASLPAVATLQVAELYLHNGTWKLRSLGDGYAEGLEKLLTVHGIVVSEDDTPPPAVSSAPAPPATPVNMEKQRIVDLRKQVEATGNISLIKSFDSAAVNLEKKGLVGQRAEVVLALDVSWSSKGLFKSGAYQALVTRAIAAAMLFDDNGTIEAVLFDSTVHDRPDITLANHTTWAKDAVSHGDIWHGTEYAPPLDELTSGVKRGAKIPTFIIFITDGGNQDKAAAKRIMIERAGVPAFVKFIAVGKERDFPFLQKLDDLKGREIDNADFFAVEDPKNISDDAFFELMMQEFREWVVEARKKGILGS